MKQIGGVKILKKKEVYICVTLYHLYLTLLLINKRKSRDDCVMLLNANDEQIYKQFCKLEISLQENGYKVNCRLRNKIKDILGIEAIENIKQYKWTSSSLGKGFDDGFVLFNFAWNLQYIYSTANLFYRKSDEAYFIEEGALTAINPPQPKWKVLIKKITGTVVDFYREDKLKGIYVQKLEIYPEEWKNKLKILEMKELLKSLDKDVQQTILTFFLGDLINSIDIEENTGIIYTQPLSEDGYISEDQKKDYYQQMVKFYSKYGRPVVKLHPRDLTEYRFEESCTVLPSFFPSELLALLNIQFAYAVGICTSAVLTTDAKIKLNINENFLIDKKFKLVSI